MKSTKLSSLENQGMLEIKNFLHEIEALLRGFENSFEYN
jgi:hypothetical protein